MSDQPILVSDQPVVVLARTDTPAREGRGWRHRKLVLQRGAGRASWGWPGEVKTYPSRRAALRAGRSS